MAASNVQCFRKPWRRCDTAETFCRRSESSMRRLRNSGSDNSECIRVSRSLPAGLLFLDLERFDRLLCRAGTLFARAGWNVLAIDMLHYGERKTDLVPVITTSELVARLYGNPPVYLQWVSQTVKDAGRSYDFLVTERGADPERIALVGTSRGAVISMIIGGADPRFKAVVLLYPGHYLATETIAHLPAACPANYLGRISPRPVLMINGTTDNLFLRESSVLPLQRLAKEPKTVLWLETGHMGNFREDLPQVANWLRDHVR